MAYFNEFIKHRPHDHCLGKKGGRVMIFRRNNLSPREVNVSGINEHDEMIGLKLNRYPLTNIIVGCWLFLIFTRLKIGAA